MRIEAIPGRHRSGEGNASLKELRNHSEIDQNSQVNDIDLSMRQNFKYLSIWFYDRFETFKAWTINTGRRDRG